MGKTMTASRGVLVVLVVLLAASSAQLSKRLHEIGYRDTLDPALHDFLKNEIDKDEDYKSCFDYISITQAGFDHSFRVWEKDLNSDGNKELIVQGGGECLSSVTGNSAFWVITKTPSGLVSLLNDRMTQSFKVLKNRTKGYSDIEIRTHGSAFYYPFRVYRFDGYRYEGAECGDISYEGDQPGVILKKPRVTRGPCRVDKDSGKKD